MLYSSANFRRSIRFAGSYGLLILFESLVIRSQVFQQQPELLTQAVLFDLVVLPAALFYWLIIKPAARSTVWLATAVVTFLRIALFVLPARNQPFIIHWPVFLLLLEISVLALTFLRLRTLRQTYRTLRLNYDHQTALQGSMESAFGLTPALVLVSEIQVLRFSLLGWWRLRSDVDTQQQAVTTYRESGQTALTLALLVVCLIEGLVIHVLLLRWSAPVAYLITAASGYGMLFLIADLVAAYVRPSFLTDRAFQLRLGLRWRALIPYTMIERVESLTDKPRKEPGLLNGALLITPNILLTLQEPIWVQGPYGIRKQVQKIALFVDNRQAFTHSLGTQTDERALRIQAT